MWSEWKDRFLLVADMHAPQETRKVRSVNSPWITKNVRQKIRYYHQAYKSSATS